MGYRRGRGGEAAVDGVPQGQMGGGSGRLGAAAAVPNEPLSPRPFPLQYPINPPAGRRGRQWLIGYRRGKGGRQGSLGCRSCGTQSTIVSPLFPLQYPINPPAGQRGGGSG
jgi:hypothetical protein